MILILRSLIRSRCPGWLSAAADQKLRKLVLRLDEAVRCCRN